MNVYLAGGMKTDWQDRLMEIAPGHTYFDPRSHGLTAPAEYTEWDLRHIRICDVLVAQMDSSNPSGFGMALEVGFAHALGKRVIFIDEIRRDWRDRYFAMVREVASPCVLNLWEAADALEREQS